MRRGFTLLEVMIALLILAVSLAVLLQAQAGSLANSSRSRDMTVATLLARSKMIDIEAMVFDEGFVDGEQVDKGTFEEEGYSKIKWSYRIAEIDLDVSLLGELCGGFAGDEGGLDGGEGCEGFIGGLGGLIEPVTQNIENSVRLVKLDIEWPKGKYKDGFSIKTLITRDGFSFAGNTPPGSDNENSNDNANSNATPGTGTPSLAPQTPTPTPGSPVLQ